MPTDRKKLQTWIPKDTFDLLMGVVRAATDDSDKTTAFTGKKGVMSKIVTLALRQYLENPKSHKEPSLHDLI